MSYQTKPGSVADRVLKFFAANPDELLSAADVALKFDVPVDHVFNQLRGAVDAGLLIKKPGPVAGRVLYAPGRNPALGKARSGFDLGDMARRGKRGAVDVSALAVRDGVPLPPRQDLSGQLLALLLSLKEGQSVEVPVAVRGTLARAVTRANKTAARRYEARKLGDLMGVWRTA
jgi:DNA-binding IscR family transcriptional regulator